jgi:hypothetical protein
MPRARMVGRCARKDGKANRNTEVGNRLIKMILPFVLQRGSLVTAPTLSSRFSLSWSWPTISLKLSTYFPYESFVRLDEIMENINWSKLGRLQKSIRRLTRVTQIQFDKFHASPRYAQSLWEEIQHLENLIEENKRSNVDFDFLDPLKKEELIGEVDRAGIIINELWAALQSLKWTENVEELLAVLSEKDITGYCDQLRFCRQKLAASLDFLKVSVVILLRRLLSHTNVLGI